MITLTIKLDVRNRQYIIQKQENDNRPVTLSDVSLRSRESLRNARKEAQKQARKLRYEEVSIITNLSSRID